MNASRLYFGFGSVWLLWLVSGPSAWAAGLDPAVFRDPPAEYRGAPFWSWNTKMLPSHVTQLDRLKEMGFGGACIHARTGLDTVYLGDDFMALVKSSVQRAGQNRMYILLYDEDRWPSGFAGGLVTRDPQYRQRRLLWTSRETVPSATLVGRYEVTLDADGCLAGYHRVTGDKKADWSAWIQIAEPSTVFNNQTYVDTLNRAAIEKFIAVTHEPYLQAVGGEFGKRIPCIFTDEPELAAKGALPKAASKSDVLMPFTDDFLTTYERAYGQNLEEFLPELFWELPDGRASVARYRYHDHVAERFARAFSETIGQWCAAHGIALTGHLMAESPLSGQSKFAGDAMRSLRHFQVPGIDMLCDRMELLTAKQAQSVAHQAGRERMMSELYGVTGWQFDFAGHKRQGDWQAALGVTLRVPHLAWASMAGEGKRDYPAAIGWQSPWYKEYPLVEGHFARVNTAMTRGTPVVRVGVIHPIESYWLASGPMDQTGAERDRQDKAANDLCAWLLFAQQDFDFISEANLPSQAANLPYDIVIAPNPRTIRGTTLDYLEHVGTVIFAGEVPALVDGVRSDRARELAARCRRVPWEAGPLVAALEPVREVRVTPGDNVIYQLRQEGSRRYLFLCNTNGERTDAAVRIAVKGDWDVTRLDTITGTMEHRASQRAGDWTEMDWPTHSHGSLLLSLESGWKPEGQKLADQEWREAGQLEGTVPVTLAEPNVLLLDQAQWRWQDGPWQPREEILRIDDVLREKLGVPLRRGRMAQPWTDQEPPLVLGNLQLKFTFPSEVKVAEAALAIEDAEKVSIELDGKAVAVKVAGWWVDECLKKVALPSFEPGEHTLVVTLPFTRKANVEWCYLLGDFGVKVNGRDAVLTQPVRALKSGNWVEQGLPFYAGNVTYHYRIGGTGRSTLLSVPRFQAPLLSVSLDDQSVGRIAFPPFEADLGVLAGGEHRLDVTAYGNRANAFGIVHHTDQSLLGYRPGDWRVRGKDWTYEYRLREMGILAAPSIKRREAVIPGKQ